jgi:hypothetical protein
MNALMVLFEAILVGCAVAFLAIDPKDDFAMNIVLITILVCIVLHVVVNVLFVARGKWLVFNCM